MIETKLLGTDENSINAAAELIKAGEVVGIPTETVYGLGANAFDENAVESSARQGKKQYYSHTVPSYLGNFMKKIQNLQPNKKIPQEWIEEYDNMSDDFQKFFQKPDDYYHYFLFHEFGRFDWFFHISYIKDKDDPNKLIAVDGRWMSDWIKDLYNGSENDRFEYVN